VTALVRKLPSLNPELQREIDKVLLTFSDREDLLNTKAFQLIQQMTQASKNDSLFVVESLLEQRLMQDSPL